MAEDHHAVLGVRADASMDEILQAYSELVERFHPDLNHDDPDAEKKFIQIQRSFGMLYEPERHRAAGTFYTDLWVFRRVRGLSSSIRRSPYSGDLRVPLIAIPSMFFFPFLFSWIFHLLCEIYGWFPNPKTSYDYGTTYSYSPYSYSPDPTPEQMALAIIGLTLVYILYVMIVLLRIPWRKP